MKVKEVPFENLTIAFLMELEQNGGKGIVDGDKRVLRIISEELVDALETDSEANVRL
jgi:hypothetical protein